MPSIKQILISLPLLFYGIFLLLLGMGIYVAGVLMGVPRILFGLDAYLLDLNEFIVWYSGIPVLLGIALCLADLFLLLPHKRTRAMVMMSPPGNRSLTVVLTAYNDEASIGLAVRDFQAHPLVKRVIVVSNNSTDGTLAAAEQAGAIVVNEAAPGYGHCVYRCFQEGLRYDDTELLLLCEGDMTFRAFDVDKFMAYIPHASIVNGTRIVEQLREHDTQLSTFMYYGNFFVGKLLEFKHVGKGTFTDVGTTYKLCRSETIRKLLPHLNSSINLEFNAYFLDKALQQNEIVVECPVTFHARVGRSKGGNVNNRRALAVGTRMIRGLLLGWPERA
ncbi:MAG: glycosyl transferase [Nitrospirae bacterium GWD2_57_9]|nr:MAG: glycosyl transferase [Nitrospirae bacterium GWD2_57_9]